MRYYGTAITDTGTRKPINQDSVRLIIKETNNKGQVVLAVVCDGIGGLEHGEVASSAVTKSFADWYNKSLPALISSYTWNQIKQEWELLISECNYKIRKFGDDHGYRLGTTLTAMLIIEDRYMIAQVGDSRAYCLNRNANQITIDHNYMNHELDRGLLSVNSILSDKRKYRLTKTIGTSEIVNPDFFFGEVESGTIWLLCSDGFRHRTTPKEMICKINPDSVSNVADLQTKGRNQINLIKERGEKDNISVLMVKAENA